MLFEDTEKEEINPEVPRFRRGDGAFVVIRFRNKADLIKFANLVDEPQLKTMKSGSTKKIKWHADKDKRDAIGQFFGDDE